MTGQHDIENFQKMWAWLMGYPAHDQKYYMKHVAKLDKDWDNDCPLSNRSEVSSCDGCHMLWKSHKGTLCSDSSSPLYKWKNTDVELPDERSYYASQTAVLAMKFLRSYTDQAEC